MSKFNSKRMAYFVVGIIAFGPVLACTASKPPVPERAELLETLFGPPSEAYLATEPPKGTASVKDAQAALDAEPNSRELKIRLSFALYNEGRLKEAAIAFDQFSYKSQEFEADRLRYLAVCKEYIGEYNEAAESYALASKLVTKDKEASDLKFLAGLNYLRIADYSEADRLLDEAVRIDKDHGFPVLAQFASAFDQKNWSEAAKILERGREFDQPNLKSRFEKARLLLAQVKE